MKRSQVLVPFLFILILVARCSSISTESDQDQIPFKIDDLNSELADPRLLQKLGVEEVVLLEMERFRVTIAEAGRVEPIGELYYTIQDGWHLKAENEIFEFVPGEGWIIAEQ